MVNITAKETEEESEKSSFEATEKVVVSSGEMSFEAVPCMFKSRQEDGAEGSLFGLLIRPATIASTSTTTTELNNTILINNGVVNNDSGKEMLVATSGNVAIEGTVNLIIRDPENLCSIVKTLIIRDRYTSV
uniref:Uncharacterized protein n=1 Tax=Meloidogyne enterolobii TaxID=390850 RepID=A0A6V7U7E2_MELEN|nr:unnamed protein product [Meloidogyne enterolobii]